MNEHASPFKTLGTHLKYLREQQSESLAEVSGAVEIETEKLERIEQGVERPSEDILMLLINHFGMQDHEAVQLWELAGYDGSQEQFLRPMDSMASGKSMMVLVALDQRTNYTDGVHIHATPAGITMNFTQANGQPQPLSVAKVGMSMEQAEQVLKTLQQALLHVRYNRGPKGLPPSADSTS